MPFVLTTGQRHEATPFERLTERAVRRASAEFASTGPQYALDKKIWAMLGFGPCQEVNTETSMVEDSDIEDLRAAGWGEQGVYEAAALISLFNYSGRTEAASGLLVGRIPEEARLPEATLGKATAAQARAWEDSMGTRDSVEASLKLPGDASYRGAPVANIRLQTEPSTKEMPLASSKRSPNPVKPARAGLALLRRERLPVVCRTNGSLSDRLPPSRMGYSSGSLE
jgi:hypothetical protein